MSEVASLLLGCGNALLSIILMLFFEKFAMRMMLFDRYMKKMQAYKEKFVLVILL